MVLDNADVFTAAGVEYGMHNIRYKIITSNTLITSLKKTCLSYDLIVLRLPSYKSLIYKKTSHMGKLKMRPIFFISTQLLTRSQQELYVLHLVFFNRIK